MSDGPLITRVRHELKRRTLVVTRVERPAPHMLRAVLSGAELSGFMSLAFDDHVKLFFADAAGEPAKRDFTPRYFDAASGELWLDFFLHEAGPAAAWAAQATIGQTLEVGGPKGSAVLSAEGIATHVLLGDETALPAIGRFLEELPADSQARVFVEVDTLAEWRDYLLPGRCQVVWIERGSQSTPAQSVIAALSAVSLPRDRAFYWVAMEKQCARAIRRFLQEERGVDEHWIKASAYWKRATVETDESDATSGL